MQIEEVSGVTKTKYRQFVLPRQQSKGKNISKILRFDKNLLGRKMSEKEAHIYEVKLYAESGDEKSIMAMNPEMVAKMKYLVKIDPEEMFAENREWMQRLMTMIYPMWRQDPLIDAEALVRIMSYSFFRSQGDELLASQSEIEKLMKMEVPAEQNRPEVTKEATNMKTTSLAI
jgi:hypothetical protein